MIINNFTIKEILGSALSKTKENAWFLFCLFVAVFAITGAVHRIEIINFIVAMIVGISIIAVSLSIENNKKPVFEDLTKSFKSYKIFLNYILSSLLYTVIVILGTILLILPGIYLAVRLSFYRYIVVEKENIGVIDALKESMKITQNRFWKIFGFMLVLILINILGVIPFGLGLIVTIPLSVIAVALVYRKLEHHTHLV